jgi:hypothetical protein
MGHGSRAAADDFVGTGVPPGDSVLRVAGTVSHTTSVFDLRRNSREIRPRTAEGARLRSLVAHNVL